MSAPASQDAVFRARRRALVSQHPQQIGLDYIELLAQPPRLRLHFIPAAAGVSKTVRPAGLAPANIRVLDATGHEPAQLRVSAISPLDGPNEQAVDLSLATDPSAAQAESPAYTLELRDVPHLDPFFTQATFTLTPLGTPSQTDPAMGQVVEALPLATPDIDYLARDFSGFRRLLLQRLSHLMPDWHETHPADLSHTLVEILAYAADQLSYYQDAVATEAYLGTARRRVSAQRHARLLDYTLHEGCNARVWVHIQVNAEVELPAGTKILTRLGGLAAPVLSTAQYLQAPDATVFETMHPMQLRPAHNTLHIYPWGQPEVVLPQGATQTTLRDHFPDLKPGQVLVFEEQPGSGSSGEAHPEHRHAVRLTEVGPDWDALGVPDPGARITHIAWDPADALPFPLPVAAAHCPTPLSLAHGNIVLADHGRAIDQPEVLPAPSAEALQRYRPQLQSLDLTFAMRYHHDIAEARPASATLAQDPRRAVPAIRLTSSHRRGDRPVAPTDWEPHVDLLDSDRFTPAFVVEMESDRRAQLRFGDGIHGQQPVPGQPLETRYRVGNGPQGNVAHEALAHLVSDDAALKITAVRNPLPAIGGTAPEALEQARLYAPQAFCTQERCVTEADYATIASRHPDVRQARAFFHWTGSWYTATLVVERYGGRPVDAAFRDALLAQFVAYRLIGYDLAVRAPLPVALDLALTVHVAPTHAASTVKQALLEALSAETLPQGRRGFFHPDAWSMGQPLYLSQIIAHAMRVPGVVQVETTRLQRLGRAPQDELRAGRLLLGPLEVVRLHTGPGAAHASQVALTMHGGREMLRAHPTRRA